VLASLAAAQSASGGAQQADTPAALASGYHVAFLVGAIFAAMAATIGGAWLRPGAQAAAHTAAQQERDGGSMKESMEQSP